VVEQGIEFVRLKQSGIERDQLTAELTGRMEAEILLRSRELEDLERRSRGN